MHYSEKPNYITTKEIFKVSKYTVVILEKQDWECSSVVECVLSMFQALLDPEHINVN